MKWNIPEDHPRYHSLLYREKILEGWQSKVVTGAGVIAQGRGESFDYLVGEKTHEFAFAAIQAAAYAFAAAKNPVISVNGNVAALCPEGLVNLSRITGAPLEINLFYREPGREEAIEAVLKNAGAGKILGIEDEYRTTIPELTSDRRFVDKRGIASADLVFVPLEDGDRTEALVKMNKTVITVDLNPLSRTAQQATITIIDNIVRALPLLSEECAKAKTAKEAPPYNNKEILKQGLVFIADELRRKAENQ